MRWSFSERPCCKKNLQLHGACRAAVTMWDPTAVEVPRITNQIYLAWKDAASPWGGIITVPPTMAGSIQVTVAYNTVHTGRAYRDETDRIMQATWRAAGRMWFKMGISRAGGGDGWGEPWATAFSMEIDLEKPLKALPSPCHLLLKPLFLQPWYL